MGRLGCVWSWFYVIASVGGCGPSGRTPQKVRVCSLWPRRSQSDPRIADKNDSIPCASCYNRNQGSGPSKAYPRYPLRVLLREQGQIGSGDPTVSHVRLHELPKNILGRRRGRSRCSGARCSGAKCSGCRCSGGGAWSERAKVCLRGGEATRLGGSSGATGGGSPGHSWGRSPGNTLDGGCSHRSWTARGSHFVGWQGAELFAFQTRWLNCWWSF